METHSWIVLAMAWLATLAILSKVFNYRHRRCTSPPGPKPWPIIGNLNFIGPLPHQSLHKLSQKYRHVMQLKFGSYSVVVASSAEMAKQFLKTHDHIFASRPAIVAGKYTTYNYSNITWSPYGLYWRQGRKILLTELFSGKRLESYEYIRVEERQAFISQLFALSGKPIMLRGHISHMTLSVMSRIVLGKKYISESLHDKSVSTVEEFQEMLDELFFLNGVVNVGDWIPWIDFLDLQGYVKRMKALSKKFERFHDLVLGEHIARKEEEKDFVAKDMVDVLLQLLDDPNLEIKLNGDSVKAFILMPPHPSFIIQPTGYPSIILTADFETNKDIKENLCYLSYDYKRKYQLGVETTILVKNYTLLDGRVIKVGTERFQAPKALFTPVIFEFY
ncbi:Trimethyltridecatetraene synthase [Camellia lanceoleosa]|uniref:Trimethyltridecatetraene synthase n=1 Tax=Camellia lanceoleosa TaxID=1840588 RepID=A0ACC0I456_9ERIC|nr:Trimethyltridecatetraene synthase [Camellia lanceoleosa]